MQSSPPAFRFGLRTLLGATSVVAVCLWAWETARAHYNMSGAVGAIGAVFPVIIVTPLICAAVLLLAKLVAPEKWAPSRVTWCTLTVVVVAWSVRGTLNLVAYRRGHAEVRAILKYAEEVRHESGAYPMSLSGYEFLYPEHESQFATPKGWLSVDPAEEFFFVWYPGGNQSIHHAYSTKSGYYFEDD